MLKYLLASSGYDASNVRYCNVLDAAPRRQGRTVTPSQDISESENLGWEFEFQRGRAASGSSRPAASRRNNWVCQGLTIQTRFGPLHNLRLSSVAVLLLGARRHPTDKPRTLNIRHKPQKPQLRHTSLWPYQTRERRRLTRSGLDLAGS